MTQNQIKYCDKCEKTFKCHAKYLIHCETELHKTGKRKTRTNKKADIICSFCNIYTTRQTTNMKLHILNNHSNNEDKKKAYTHYCEYCDVGYFIENKYNKHLDTTKHKIKISTINNL
jgi:hypothetical protein